jgi:hypothetical protein
MTDVQIIYSLTAFCFLLGFVALLKQKTYIDSQTNQPTDIELPLIGKLKSNYPALAFVIVGAFLAYAGWSKTPTDLGDDQWSITGSFVAPNNANVKWEDGNLVLLPRTFEPAELQDGRFMIQASIQKGKRFEDVVSAIVYTNGKVSAQINVEDEYNKRISGRPSLLQTHSKTSRDYAPQVVAVYPVGGN